MELEPRAVKESRTLRDAIDRLRYRGFRSDFIRAGDRLRETESGREFAPEQLSIVDHSRFEGASDPADMAVIYAVESPAGDRGVIIDAFGTYADPELGRLLQRMQTRELSTSATH